jgi:hypothetical protein
LIRSRIKEISENYAFSQFVWESAGGGHSLINLQVALKILTFPALCLPHASQAIERASARGFCIKKSMRCVDNLCAIYHHLTDQSVCQRNLAGFKDSSGKTYAKTVTQRTYVVEN